MTLPEVKEKIDLQLRFLQPYVLSCVDLEDKKKLEYILEALQGLRAVLSSYYIGGFEDSQ
jgi:hypothetical protein